jgi:hypothetical protein
VRDGLIKRGLDPDTATAFAANSLHESGANPNVGAGDAGASHGLFQWRDARATSYQQTFGHAPDNAPLDEQLDNVVRELNTTEGAARDRIAAAQGPAAKAAAVSQYYLRPKDVGPEMQRRGGTALQLVSQLGGSGQPARGGQVILGDSYASPQGLGGSGVVGAQPGNSRSTDVLAQIQQQARTGGLRGKDVVISTGAVNAGGDTSRVAEQIQTAHDAGANSVTVVGAVETPQYAQTNQQLEQIAQQNGARFVPAGPAGTDPNHPASYAPLRQAVRLGGTATAGPGAGSPPASTAPVTGTPGATTTAAPTVPQPPQNQALPGQPNGPQITGPQPPALPPLNANGLDARQQQMVDAAARTGRISPTDQVKMQDTFRQQNIALQQKAYSDYIQAQQLAVAQGHLTVDQANSNLEYWKAANDLDITKTGDELIVTNKRTGQVVSRTPITPDMRPETLAMTDIARLAPKIRDGTATQAEQDRYATAVDTWRQPEIIETNALTHEKGRVNKRELPSNFPPPQGEQGSATGGPQVITPGMSLEQQEAGKELGKKFATDDLKAYAGANNSLYSLGEMNNAAEVMNRIPGSWTATGPGANVRLGLGQSLNTIGGLFGIDPKVDPAAIGSWEALNKQTKLMGFKMINAAFGASREAASVIQNATSAVPNSENTYLGFRLVSSGIEQELARERELYEYKGQLVKQGKPLTTAEVDFTKTHPTATYVQRAVANAVPDDIASYLTAHPDTVKAFDGHFGPGIGEFIIQGGRTGMGTEARR